MDDDDVVAANRLRERELNSRDDVLEQRASGQTESLTY